MGHLMTQRPPHLICNKMKQICSSGSGIAMHDSWVSTGLTYRRSHSLQLNIHGCTWQEHLGISGGPKNFFLNFWNRFVAFPSTCTWNLWSCLCYESRKRTPLYRKEFNCKILWDARFFTSASMTATNDTRLPPIGIVGCSQGCNVFPFFPSASDVCIHCTS